MTLNKIAIHQKTLAVQWGDMDALGHVNNVRYLDYFQEARIEWLRELNLDMMQTHGPVVVHIACTFLKPIIYPATITIHSSLHSIGRSSFMVDHEVFQGDQLMAEGMSKIVWVDYAKGKSVSLPESIRHYFNTLENNPPRYLS